MNPGPAEPLRDVIARHGLQANKALGQNFILDRHLLARIAAIPGPLDGAIVYEVGPGPGGLTRALLETGAKVIAVERDRRCAPALAELGQDFPGKLEVIDGDAMQMDERALAGDGAHVVANLPYNVGTALLLRWLGGEAWPPWWRSLTAMFQREVAERIVAAAGSEHYGRLSIAAQWRSRPRMAMTVHRSAFVPPPKVASAIVHLVPAEMPVESALASSKADRRAFGHAKMLRQSLKNMTVPRRARAIGIDPNGGRNDCRRHYFIARELSST